jgi:sterol desaturase/sphingolipid hydroxylase (fatty acid hydroxylase superfamily)
MNDGIFACVGALGFVVIVLAFIIVLRYINYKETMNLAEKGLARPQPARRNSDGKDTLRWGIILAAIGLALILGMWPLGSLMHMDLPLGFGPWMVIGLLPLFFGLGLVLIYVLTSGGKKDGNGGEPPVNSDHLSENNDKEGAA